MFLRTKDLGFQAHPELADVYGIERRLAFWASFGGHNEKIRQLIAGNHSTRIGELQRLARGPGAGFNH
jgi:hypothetical protein